jgi:hypothetical protein
MARFLKLTNFILNANDIKKIAIEPNKYYIHLAYKNFNGNLWSVGAFGFGAISSYTDVIEVCGTNHSDDYKLVSEWINKV